MTAGRPSWRSGRVWLVISILLLTLAPIAAPMYVVNLLVLSFVYAVFALSVDLIWGYAGVLSFGQAAFFGMGAYAVAKLAGTNPAVGLAAGVVLAAAVAVLVASVLFRRGISEEYFAIITLAIAVIAEQITTSWTAVTGGSNGLPVPAVSIGLPGVGGLSLDGIPMYVAAAAVMLGTVLLARRIVRSPFGRVLVAIDQNEVKARSLGYDVARYKTVAFGLSGGLAGFAGGLYAIHAGFVSPSLLGFGLSTAVLIWVLVGGRGTLVGPVLGVTFITIFENLISGVFVFWWTLFLGASLVLIVLAFPGGIIGAISSLAERLDRTAAA